MKASIASSAQCRSSTTSTAGPAAARPSRNSRQAAKFSSREASSASRPRSGRRRARRRSRSAPSGSTASRRASLRATPSLSRMPAEARTISESAQKVTFEPKGRQRPWRQVTSVRPVVEAAGELGQQAALADAGLADDEGEAADWRPAAAVEQLLEGGELLLAADEARGEAAQLRAGARQGGGGDPGAQRLALALEGDRVAGVEGEDLLGGGVGGLADGDRHRRRRATAGGRRR